MKLVNIGLSAVGVAVVLFVVWMAVLIFALKQVDFKGLAVEAGQEIKQITHEIQEYEPK